MKYKVIIFILIIFTGFSAYSAYGKDGISVIRDAEIENVIRQITTPILNEAGLPPENVKIIIVNSNQLNAFVAGGMNIFIYTGLITLNDDPAMLRAVLAHEVGHIVGSHLIRRSEQQDKILAGSIFSYVLGAATALVSGSPTAAQAIIASGTEVAKRNVLSYNRGQERAADQYAIKILNKLGFSASGLLKIMEALNKQENLLLGNNITPYLLTHPATDERIAYIRAHIKNSEDVINDAGEVKDLIRRDFRRITVKLRAFLGSPDEILLEYAEDKDDSIIARYARAIAYYRKPDLSKSLFELDGLIKDNPDDPYLWELKGQILFENGKISESVKSYSKAHLLKPDAALIKLGLAAAQIAEGGNANLKNAITNLTQASLTETETAIIWHQLSIAHGKLGNIGMADYALAEEALLLGKKEEAVKFAKRAKGKFKPGEPIYTRINDILTEIKKEI